MTNYILLQIINIPYIQQHSNIYICCITVYTVWKKNDNLLKVISMLTKAKVINVNVGEEGIAAAVYALSHIASYFHLLILTFTA